MSHDPQTAEASSAFVEGVVDRLYDKPRDPPADMDDDEQRDWLEGYDA
jgi:hypothetical protein